MARRVIQMRQRLFAALVVRHVLASSPHPLTHHTALLSPLPPSLSSPPSSFVSVTGPGSLLSRSLPPPSLVSSPLAARCVASCRRTSAPGRGAT